jgi:hypothetical protein
MFYPPLVEYPAQDDYRAHFEQAYCRGTVTTFDGIAVRFRKKHFDHAFFERSVRRSGAKDTFSIERARRIAWIGTALADPDAELFIGWDSLHKRDAPGRRVALVCENFVVVIAIIDEDHANFVTAFVADTEASLDRIRRGARWPRK